LDLNWRWWVTANDVILPPQVLSDVTTTDANCKGREWYHQAKFIADIIKENDMIKLIGKGCKQYHKTKLIGEDRKQYLTAYQLWALMSTHS
jgi:hypothetical protein